MQTSIPLEMAMLHNFICRHDLDKIEDFNEVDLDPDPSCKVGVLALGPPGQQSVGQHRIDIVRWQGSCGPSIRPHLRTGPSSNSCFHMYLGTYETFDHHLYKEINLF